MLFQILRKLRNQWITKGRAEVLARYKKRYPDAAARGTLTLEPLDLGGPEACDPRRVEAREGRTIAAAPGQDGRPAEPRLRALEDEEFEEPPIGAHGHAPLAVMIGNVGPAPGPVTASALARHRHST